MYDNQKNSLLILVDGSFYLYRFYYAYPELYNHINEPIGAIHGLLVMLKKILIRYQPNYMAVIFDSAGKTFRHELFQYYKSNRSEIPENLFYQIKFAPFIIKLIGLTTLTIHGVEADDIIGTLALEASKNGLHVLIMTGDKDMTQLVSSNITMMNYMSNTLGPKEVELKFGIPPSLIVDYLALIGDRSDNIPGVPGIGKKTATILLNQLGGIKSLYQHLDQIRLLNMRGSKNVTDKLNKYRKFAFLSYQLATINTNIILHLSYDQLIIRKPEYEILIDLQKRFNITIYDFNFM